MDPAVLSPDKMNFYNIFPYSPGEEELLAQEAIEYAERTGNEIILYCMTLHPQGFPAMNKAEQYLASYRKLKAALAGSKVKLGVLFQSILGHWPRVDKNEEQWTRTVNSNGEKVRFCPLDENFRKYIYDVTVMFAGEKPVLILGDDDIRAFSPNAECFCPAHTAEFSRRMGREYTQEEYIKAINDSQPGDKSVEVFMQLQREMVDGVAALIRSAIDSVDPEIPAGSCMPSWEFLFNSSTAKSFASASQPALMRICNSDYLENGVNIFPEVVVRTQALYQLHKDIPVVLDESDTCPHNLFSRSATSMTAKLVTSIMSGLNGAKLWFVNAHKNGFAVNRRYTDFLAAREKFFPELLRAVRRSSFSGIAIPASSRCPAWHPVHYYWQFMVPQNSWASTMFGILGIPFNVTYDLAGEEVYALAGSEAVNMFDDGELKTLLSGKLLLDGGAAAELSRRGFDEYMGISAEKKDFRFNGEENCISGQNYTITKDEDTPFITVKNAGVKVMTELIYTPYGGSPLKEKAAPGTTFFRNALGGHICVTAFHMNEFVMSRWNEPRKAWLLNIIDTLAEETIPAVLNEQKYLALSRKETDGSSLMTIVNIGFDKDENIRIKYAGYAGKVQQLSVSGLWEDVPFVLADDVITVLKTMECYEYAVLRIS